VPIREGKHTCFLTVVDNADYTVITRSDAEDVVVMSLDSFNSLIETFHLLKSPANAAISTDRSPNSSRIEQWSEV
jgi:PHD/YefM family antitoxin component YafN of YafNO toxin-antitoxin module